MDEELSTADPLAPNGGLLPKGTGKLRERLTETLCILQASTRTKWTRS
jgi:hypothetical protein